MKCALYIVQSICSEIAEACDCIIVGVCVV